MRSGGAGASATTEFGEASFRVLQTADPTLDLAFVLTALTADRAITMPDAAVDLTKLTDLIVPSIPASSAAATKTITSADAGGTMRFSAAVPVTFDSGAAGDWGKLLPTGVGAITCVSGTATVRYNATLNTLLSRGQNIPIAYEYLTATDVLLVGTAAV